MHPFSASSTVYRLLPFLFSLLSLLPSPSAQAQCAAGSPTVTVVTTANASQGFRLGSGQTLCIGRGVRFTGQVTLTGTGATISNYGTSAGNYNITTNNYDFTILNYGTWSTEFNAGRSALTIVNGGTWNAGQLAVGNVLVVNEQNADWRTNLYGWGQVSIKNNGTWNAYQVNAVGATLTNRQQWHANVYAAGSDAYIENSGTWDATQFDARRVTLTNTGTWRTRIHNAEGVDITNAGTWDQTLGFPATGTSRFANTGSATFNELYFNGGAVELRNQGTFVVLGIPSFHHATFSNKGALITANGANLLADATLDNQQTWTSGLLQNAGTLRNTGTVRATRFANNGGTVYNQGTVDVGQDFANNGGLFHNLVQLSVQGTFVNNGTVAGPTDGRRGLVRVAGYSTNNGPFGTVGLLDFCDASSTTNGRFDTPNTAPSPTVTYCGTEAAAPLPVTLLRFTAARVGTAVALHWKTAAEISNRGFAVEQSTDGRQWQQVAFVPGRGAAAVYQWQQEAPARTLYYRLAQHDLDGTITYAPAVVVPAAEAATLTLYPNPAHDQVRLAGLPATEAPVLLLDSRGQLVRQFPASPTLALQGLPAGLYLVRCGNATARLLVK